MKKVNYLVYSLMVILFLCTIGCSNSEESKNSKIAKLENPSKEDIVAKADTVEHQSSIEDLMPEKWKVINSRITPVEKLDFYSRSFGGKVVNFENNFIASSEPYNHYKFQINIIKAYDVPEAKKIFATIQSRTTNIEKYLLKEDIVYEFMANENYIHKCRLIFSK